MPLIIFFYPIYQLTSRYPE